MLQNSNTIQPKVVVIRRRPNQGFGFTVRHFIAYPPEDDPSWPQEASDPYQVKAMETIFIKEVQPNGPAHFANLQTGDRVLMVNNKPISGIAYSTVVSMIKQTPSVLTLHVVPKECDVLQMHYSIAHTPESNRLTAVGQKPITSPINVGNGNVASTGALLPSTTIATSSNTTSSAGATGITGAKTSSSYLLNQHQLQQPLISYPPPLPVQQQQQQQQKQQQQHQLALVAASRSGSITSTTSGNLRAMPSSTSSGGGGVGAAASGPIDFIDMTQNFHHGRLLMRGGSGDGGCASNGAMRSQPPSLSVLTRQQQLQQQQLQNPAYIGGGSGGVGGGGPADTNDLMIRLRESIKQKEEFLKSPLPHAAGSPQQQQPTQQHFFPHTPPQAASPQMSLGPSSSSSTSNGSAALNSQVRLKSGSRSPSSARGGELLPSSCDLQTFYAKNLPGGAYENAESLMQRHSLQNVVRIQRQAVGNGNLVSTLRDKYSKDFDYMESLQETGVTNKVFERKLVSHMSKGFDPFKPLSIQTNVIESSAAPGNVVLMKKPGVLYDSLQHHPLHQLQVQQIQKTTVQPRVHHMAHSSNMATVSGGGLSAVDGQQHSRMEIHKASVAKLTSDHCQDVACTKYTTQTGKEDKTLASSTAALTDIAESSDFNRQKANEGASSSTSSGVVRRFKPVSSFDDSKPMRRISYLRATNNENDYQSDTSSIATTTTTTNTIGGGGVSVPNSVPSQLQHQIELTKEQSEEDSDPTYDVVGDARDNLDELSLDQEESEDAVASGDVSTTNGREMVLVPTLTFGSRRTSLNSEMRNSIHIDSLALENNGKLETKDVATEIEIFETEMEIKSSCINGKRLSEYRSWRQVKIEIKGDILKIYPSRHSKSENNVIELDIRNFQFVDESVDKKKYIFRMVSKPNTNLASLGNELAIEDASDKLTSSGSSSSTVLQIDQQQHTEILFKTKSITEMRRIFGLLQWKNSLIYDDSDLQGKQLAEPQKTAATSSVPTTTAFCDDSVQQKTLQPEYSPQSSIALEPTDSISPSMKARKSSSHKNIPEKDLGSPKAKNWKDLLFRRGGGSGGSSSGSHSADISPSNLSSSAKTTGSIGVPLRSCPMSKDNEFVPHIVDVCTSIVESKGLGIVGIYRIPGNKAAISELSEQVNKTDFSWDRCNTDVRWEDVNVVSSLLKLFIRSLPDALLPSSYYINFIEADKKTGLVRLRDLKEILESLPRHSYETMKHLIRHLHRVSKNCNVNLMEPKNLAIIFGPSIIRTPNDTLEIAVKDMKHQCRIVELLVTQYEYFFENGSTPDIADISGNNPAIMATGSTSAAGQSQEEQTNMLLHNVSKIERLTERETTRTSRFIPQLRRRAHGNKRGAVANSDTYSGESVLSLDDTKSSHTTSTTMASSSSSSSTMTTLISSKSSSGGTALAVKKKERGGFLHHGIRTHKRNSSLDEKDSGSASGGSGGSSTGKDQQRSSVDMSAHLSDEESSNSRISDTGSMSLTTITDTLDTKLRNLRSGSESNDENGSPEFPKNRRHTFGQPLHLHSENIPYADESPERLFHSSCPLDTQCSNALMMSRSCTTTNTFIGGKVGSAGNIALLGEKLDKEQRPHTLAGNFMKAGKLQHSATAPMPQAMSTPPTAASTPTTVVTVKTGHGSLSAGGVAARNSYMGKNLRFSSSVYEQCCSEDDSEGSTTSDPKESLVIASPSVFLDRYNKKRRDHRLFRSASFNSRNYSSRHCGAGGGGGVIVTPTQSSGLTKDEKTDMNLTKKRQIQNKQNRSIKRRHTVGGPHDYAGPTQAATITTGPGVCAQTGVSACGHHCRGVSSVLRRISIPTANGNNTQSSDGNLTANVNVNGSNGSVGNNNGGAAAVGGGGEHVLEVGIRIKNINRSRY